MPGPPAPLLLRRFCPFFRPLSFPLFLVRLLCCWTPSLSFLLGPCIILTVCVSVEMAYSDSCLLLDEKISHIWPERTRDGHGASIRFQVKATTSVVGSSGQLQDIYGTRALLPTGELVDNAANAALRPVRALDKGSDQDRTQLCASG